MTVGPNAHQPRWLSRILPHYKMMVVHVLERALSFSKWVSVRGSEPRWRFCLRSVLEYLYPIIPRIPHTVILAAIVVSALDATRFKGREKKKYCRAWGSFAVQGLKAVGRSLHFWRDTTTTNRNGWMVSRTKSVQHWTSARDRFVFLLARTFIVEGKRGGWSFDTSEWSNNTFSHPPSFLCPFPRSFVTCVIGGWELWKGKFC
jgi:hypothetical protein